MTVFDRSIALLRGINVGGRNRLPMKDLREIFREIGCEDVRTYIQSGNVVYRPSAPVADSVSTAVSEALVDRFEIQVPVVVRTASELDRIVKANPFLESTPDTHPLHVGFLLERPDPDRVENLDPDRSPPDEFVVAGAEVYLRLPNGVGRSKLTSRYFDTRLRTTITIRNWRTVVTLLDMARGD
jgi:uncharacterized protein (DUF1697 family)